MLSFATLGLVGLGLLMAISVQGATIGIDAAFRARALPLLVGCVLFWLARIAPLERLRPFVLPLFVGMLLLCLYPVFFGRAVHGVRRWIQLGALSFQPVELLKPMLVFATAEVLLRSRDLRLGKRGFYLLWPATLSCLVLLLQLDVGHAFFLMCISAMLILAHGCRFRDGFKFVLGFGGILGVVLLLVPHARRRVFSFLHEPGYQISQGLAALENGGLFGQGIGQGRYKLGFVPEAKNDFILTMIGNELGLLGCLLVLAFFAMIFVAALRIAASARSDWLSIIALGLGLNLVLQACMNMLGVTHSIPEKGIDLPLLSSGGTNLVFALVSVGILANIADQSHELGSSNEGMT